ncbi:MAG: hypothetical protein ACE14S_09550 [Candidatus Bathyarchaeia archaeon]
MENKSTWAFRIGLFIVVLTWFAFSIYQAGKSIFNFDPEVAFTDLPGSVGLGFRTVTGFVAVISILFYLVKRPIAPCEVKITFRWLVLLQVAYWVFFLPAAVWGFQYRSLLYTQEFFMIEAGIPCLVEGIVMPAVLLVLFFKLGSDKPAQGAIKWGLIAAAANIFVVWFNYTSQWWSEIYLNGTGFLVQSLVYAFEFGLTVVGLLLLAVGAAVYARNSAGATSLSQLNFRKAGLILTALGLYFDILLLLHVLVPAGGSLLTVWPTFAIDHNVDLWMATLPVVGLPLVFSKKRA